MKINVITLCSGYDAMTLALKRLRRNYPQFDFDLVAWSEIEPCAIKAHKALHPEFAERNIGDMTTADWGTIKGKIDLLVYSTPCQSVSAAGKNKGMKKGDSAASSLIWHTERAIKELKPRILLLENVAGMCSGRNIKDFNSWQRLVEGYGYVNFTQLMNSKDFGVAQNRLRLFMVSILRTEDNPDPKFYFPKPLKLEKCLKDYLEDEVDEKYYLSDERVDGLITSTQKESDRGNGFAWKPTDGSGVACTLQTTQNRKTDNYLFDADEEVYTDKHR